MGIYKKSALLSLLRLRLEEDRSHDWQALQGRERSWYLGQANRKRWALVPAWLAKFSTASIGPLGGIVLILNLVGLIAGFSLVAGLLEFQTFGRINLLWFMVLAVGAPFVFWLFGLLVAASGGNFPLLSLVEHRMPQWMNNPTLTSSAAPDCGGAQSAGVPVLRVWHAAGLAALPAGYRSRIRLVVYAGYFSGSLHALSTALTWPWHALWPDAVPSLSLVEQTRYFRSAPGTAAAPAALGQWWRFLLMCLLVYVLLPRVLSYAWHRLRLSRMQARLFENDALVAGWWQRMSNESLSQDAAACKSTCGLPGSNAGSRSLAGVPARGAVGSVARAVLGRSQGGAEREDPGFPALQAAG